MLVKHFKADKYRKIRINSFDKIININCRTKPKFLHDLKNFKIHTEYIERNIMNNFINICSLRYFKNKTKSTEIDIVDRGFETCFTLKPDFSNFLDIVNRFRKFIDTNFNHLKWYYTSIENEYKTNCIIRYLNEFSNKIDVCIRDDFEEFDNYGKYNYEIISGYFPEFNNKVIFDGKLLRTVNFIIKFIKKPPFDKFIVNLDKRIYKLGFITAHSNSEGCVLSSFYDKHKNFYSIYIALDKVENFLYFKILNNIDWLSKEITYYQENDILNKIYDV